MTMTHIRPFIWIMLGAFLSCRSLAEDMDTALASFTEKLAAPIKEQGKKKIAVVDFTDLQGSSGGELGKYIAEQVSVNMVMAKRDFAVLDRANFKSILSEHKLTSLGLIDPKNAKQLGQFSGVDALIMGVFVTKGTNIMLTAKIITTDTAEIVGAARTQFTSDDNTQQLLAKPAATEAAPANSSTPPEPVHKPFGDLDAKVISVGLIPDSPGFGVVKLTFMITNSSATDTYGVAVNEDHYKNYHVSNDRGDEFNAVEVTGIEKVYNSFAGIQGTFTEIAPHSAIRIQSKSQTIWRGKAGDYRPYHLQTEIFFDVASKGRYADVRKYNFQADIN